MSRPPDTPLDERARLEEERAFLLRSIADLDREHAEGDLDDADWRRLRDEYVTRTAAVLRALDAGGGADPAPAASSVSADPTATGEPAAAGTGWWRRRRRQLVGAALVAALAVGAGVAVAGSAGRRGAGEVATGSIRETERGRVQGLLDEAGRLVQEGEPVEAIRRYDEVLEADPDNPTALANRGWLLVLAGGQREDAGDLVDRGAALLDRAVSVAPDHPDARFFRGMTRLRYVDDPAGAVEDFDAFLSLDPPADLAEMVRDLREDAAARAQP